MSDHKLCESTYLVRNPGSPLRFIRCELERHSGVDHEGGGIRWDAVTRYSEEKQDGRAGAQVSGTLGPEPRHRTGARKR